MTLTVEEKLDAIEAAGWPFAFDGCHKIYMLTSPEREKEARAYDYDVFPASQIKEKFYESCFLRFVNQWGLDAEGNAGFSHALQIEQFEMEDEEEDWEDGETCTECGNEVDGAYCFNCADGDD